jgi:hypothetical protein
MASRSGLPAPTRWALADELVEALRPDAIGERFH